MKRSVITLSIAAMLLVFVGHANAITFYNNFNTGYWSVEGAYNNFYTANATSNFVTITNQDTTPNPYYWSSYDLKLNVSALTQGVPLTGDYTIQVDYTAHIGLGGGRGSYIGAGITHPDVHWWNNVEQWGGALNIIYYMDGWQNNTNIYYSGPNISGTLSFVRADTAEYNKGGWIGYSNLYMYSKLQSDPTPGFGTQVYKAGYVPPTSDLDYVYLTIGARSGNWNPDDYVTFSNFRLTANEVSVPLPGAIWMLGAGLIGLIGIRRWQTSKASSYT